MLGLREAFQLEEGKKMVLQDCHKSRDDVRRVKTFPVVS